jgi:NAD(P)-dependent dehydrogenase (short-subunit alcohol dehydrogenase family)
MDFNGKTAIITGAGRGIGAALAREFTARGARVAVADLDAAAASTVALEIDGLACTCDVTDEREIQALVARVEAEFGPVDIFFSNAGIFRGEPDHAASATDSTWQACWQLHVMAHVYATRAVLPAMIARGDGYLAQMASAAGVLNQIGDAAYSSTKHAAVGLSEALTITHGHQGVKVSVVCPQYVATPMLGYDDPAQAEELPNVLSPEVVAQRVTDAMEAETFLILPHPDVAGYMEFKASHYEKWLSGMRKLRAKIVSQLGGTKLSEMHKWI